MNDYTIASKYNNSMLNSDKYNSQKFKFQISKIDDILLHEIFGLINRLETSDALTMVLLELQKIQCNNAMNKFDKTNEVPYCGECNWSWQLCNNITTHLEIWNKTEEDNNG